MFKIRQIVSYTQEIYRWSIAARDGDEVYIYWVVHGEFKTSKVNKAALHKLS